MKAVWAENSRRHAPPRQWMIAVAMVAFAGLYLFLYRHDLLYQWLEDLHVYAGAEHLFKAGINPYSTPIFEGLRFVYPPAVLFAGRALGAVLPHQAAWWLVAIVHLTCVLLTPFVLARYFVRAYWLTPAMALLVWLGESRFTGMLALYSCNMAPALYLAALLAAVPGIKRNRWGWFYAAVLIAGVVKITFLVVLLLPLLAGRRQWLKAGLTALGVAAAYLLQARLFPALYAGYKYAVTMQVKVEHQYGYGIFGVIGSLDEKLHRPLGIEAYAVHGVAALGLLGAMWWLRQRGADARDPSLWLGMVLMTIIVVDPRMLHYDAYLALFAAFTVLATTLELDGWKLIALVAVLFAPSLAVPHLLHTKLMYGAYELLILLAALGAGLWSLWRKSGPRLEPVTPNEFLAAAGVESAS